MRRFSINDFTNFFFLRALPTLHEIWLVQLLLITTVLNLTSFLVLKLNLIFVFIHTSLRNFLTKNYRIGGWGSLWLFALEKNSCICSWGPQTWHRDLYQVLRGSVTCVQEGGWLLETGLCIMSHKPENPPPPPVMAVRQFL